MQNSYLYVYCNVIFRHSYMKCNSQYFNSLIISCYGNVYILPNMKIISISSLVRFFIYYIQNRLNLLISTVK